MRKITYDQAANEAIQEEFRKNPRCVHLSPTWRPTSRRNSGRNGEVTPIAENSFVGTAIGLAGSGFRAVVNLRWPPSALSPDQIMNHAAKLTYMFGGQAKSRPDPHDGGRGLSGARNTISPYPCS